MQIRLLITGGTIDKSYNMNNGALHFVDSHVPSMLAEGRCRADLAIETVLLKDSLDLTDADRQLICDYCRQNDDNHIIITHGTDTMVETARLLQQQDLGKTIVLTGAMIPYVFDKSDALFNLGTAIAAVQCLPAGVYLAMNGSIFRADNVTKNRELGIFEPL